MKNVECRIMNYELWIMNKKGGWCFSDHSPFFVYSSLFHRHFIIHFIIRFRFLNYSKSIHHLNHLAVMDYLVVSYLAILLIIYFDHFQILLQWHIYLSLKLKKKEAFQLIFLLWLISLLLIFYAFTLIQNLQ